MFEHHQMRLSDAAPEPSRPPGLEVVRIDVRVDYFPVLGELDFSLAGWKFPEAEVICTERWSTYDQWHAQLAGHDLCAALCAMLKVGPDPFP